MKGDSKLELMRACIELVNGARSVVSEAQSNEDKILILREMGWALEYIKKLIYQNIEDIKIEEMDVRSRVEQDRAEDQ